jgi:hypothetical protein
MKSRFFVIVTIIALVGFVVTLDYGEVWAQQEAPTAVEVWEAKAPIPVEFSTDTLCERLFGDVDQFGVWDPQQVLYTEPPDPVNPPDTKPWDTFDFGGDIDVDALANIGDHLFGDLIVNNAVLLVSFEHDPQWNPYLPAFPERIAVYAECNGGAQFPKWSHNRPQAPLPTPHPLDWDATVLNYDLELDGLEVWGPLGLGADDANCYSLIGDPVAPGPGVKYSVFQWWGFASPYVPHSVIVTAVTNPVLTIPAEGAQHYEGPDSLVDLDALMVWDGGGNFDGVWNAGDTIIFSIRNTIPGGNWDGGEIVVLPFGGPPSYLFHGAFPRHYWHTPFDPAAAANFDLNPATQEVDGIEAYPQQPRPQTPALTEWGLLVLVALLIISTVFVLLKRRKAVVRA